MAVDLALLSHSRTFYSTRRLCEAAEALPDVAVRVIDPVRVMVHSSGPGVGDEAAWLSEDGQRIATPDVVIPRIGATLTAWSLGLLEALRQAGARSPIAPAAIALAADKLAAQQALTRAGLPTLPTVAVREPFHAADAVAAVGGAPVVIKLPQGTQGRTVMSAGDEASAVSTLAALTGLGHTALVQALVPMPTPRDLRVLVVAGRALAACWRYAPMGDFRSNVHLGGRCEAVALDDAHVALAEAAARALDAPLCGVDLIETARGFAVLEVNGSPGIEGIEAATGRDLATPIVRSALDTRP